MPTSENEAKLLGAMLQYEMRGKDTVSFRQLSKVLGFMERTKGWRNAWKQLMEGKKPIEIAEGNAMYTEECRMTKAGKDSASTPESLEFVMEQNFVPQTNEEYQEGFQERFKKIFLRRKVDAFIRRLAHGPVSREEVVTLFKLFIDRSHQFSDHLEDLKTKGYIKQSGSKHRLADKSFLKPEDRPDTVDVDAMKLEEGKLAVESQKYRKRSQAAKKDGPKERLSKKIKLTENKPDTDNSE